MNFQKLRAMLQQELNTMRADPLTNDSQIQGAEEYALRVENVIQRLEMPPHPDQFEKAGNMEHRVIFAIGVSKDGIPLLLIGMPEQAREYLLTGKNHEVDLVKVGVGLRLAIFGCKTHDEGMEMLKKKLFEQTGIIAYEDKSDIDFSIDRRRASGQDRIFGNN